MDIDNFREKVLMVTDRFKSVADIINEQGQINQLVNIISSFEILSEFVNDELNIAVLKNNCLNINGELEQCPLGLVCDNVWRKLDEIDQLLTKDFLDYLSKIDERISSGGNIFTGHHVISQLSRKILTFRF